jgi:hypothetical protein
MGFRGRVARKAQKATEANLGRKANQRQLSSALNGKPSSSVKTI